MALDADTFDALIDAVRRFVAERLRPLEAQVEADDAIPADVVAEMLSWSQGMRSRPMPRMRTGTDRTTPNQKRRVMSRSSSDGPVSAVTMTGSRAIPQMGQVPGPF